MDFGEVGSRLESKKSALRKEVILATLLFAVMFLTVTSLGATLIMQDLSRKQAYKVLTNYSKEFATILHKVTKPQTFKGYKQQTVVTTRLNAFYTEKKIFDSIELYDDKGKLVYRNSNLRGGEIVGGAGPPNLLPGQQQVETRNKIPIEVPVALKPGKMGKAILSVSEDVLARKADELRRALVTKLVGTFLIILIMMVLAYLYVLRVLKLSRRIEAESHDQERLSYLGLLSSGLAHEIKNPINSIQMNLQLMEEEVVPGEGGGNLGEWLVPVRREIRRLERLVNDFLLFSKPLKPKREPVALPALFDGLCSLIREEARRADVTVSAETDGDIPLLHTDEDLLRSALLNLLLNAVQATADSGGVSLRARAVGGSVAIDVEDEGEGIPAPERESIFSLFYTTKTGGTGLGLPIARRLVAELGGSLELVDREGPGACFRVTLPLEEEEGE